MQSKLQAILETAPMCKSLTDLRKSPLVKSIQRMHDARGQWYYHCKLVKGFTAHIGDSHEREFSYKCLDAICDLVNGRHKSRQQKYSPFITVDEPEVWSLHMESVLDSAPKCRTIKDLEESPLVDSLWREMDDDTPSGYSWWCMLKEGYCIGDGTYTLGIHENTIKDICMMVNSWVCVDEQYQQNVYKKFIEGLYI